MVLAALLAAAGRVVVTPVGVNCAFTLVVPAATTVSKARAVLQQGAVSQVALSRG